MKNTYRFFVPPESIDGGQLLVDDRDLLHQWASVLRLRVGSHLAVLDGRGRGYIVELTALDKRGASGRVLKEYAANGEPTFAAALYVALTRGERFEFVLQKGTELGATAFVPVICERSQAEGGAAKQARWERIIREAAEQSGRGVLPTLNQPTPFKDALAAGRPGILLAEGRGAVPFKAALAAAAAAGLELATLGSRILRAETAPIAALAALMFARDEWILAEL